MNIMKVQSKANKDVLVEVINLAHLKICIKIIRKNIINWFGIALWRILKIIIIQLYKVRYLVN